MISKNVLHGTARNLLAHGLLLVMLEARWQAMRQLLEVWLGEECGRAAKLARRYCTTGQLLLFETNLLCASSYFLIPIDQFTFSLSHGLERQPIVEAQIYFRLRIDEIIERDSMTAVLTRLALLTVPHARCGTVQI